MRLGALRGDRVALLDAGHHLAGRLVDVVLAVVLVLVFAPALVDAQRVPGTDPLVALTAHGLTKGLQLVQSVLLVVLLDFFGRVHISTLLLDQRGQTVLPLRGSAGCLFRTVSSPFGASSYRIA